MRSYILVSKVIEKFGENQQVFPHQPEKYAKELLKAIKGQKVGRFVTEREFKVWCINNITYLFARCIQHPKDSELWLKNNINTIKRLADELKRYCKTKPVARYLHTLGYFYLKIYLYMLQMPYHTDDPISYYYDEAKNFLDHAYDEAYKHNDHATQELVQNNLRLADTIPPDTIPVI